MSKVPSFRAFAGIAASAAIVCLLVRAGLDKLGPLSLICTLIATLSLVSALFPTSAARVPLTQLVPARCETLRLESFGITPREREFVLEYLAGKTMKEIAHDHGVSDSTVRNAFSSVYVKLGLSGGAQLSVLGACYKIE